ncbi:MAG: NifB/NifX family molybdenum-iron cluster-binding protein [Candidatus Edwardsbacteria bacterium]|nr:NifB/NifX family molybdenum-iron cluster-binding protein [Candidatus Edwardsbacteria bacterium]MBU1575707.1 NifB/NifX family molybdenum-iron cluster-binding protein [Candidatus Edwardsbacteria bacterium]MBU2464102.1 NifB/NifX family molybdenum-iron cluster-binding protein [Candidatus Edwardsbacteria bacterium]MBU2594672.1 NifB/NifX family molybdenum-iron cluster-binding protein [Candidatus Edwardsbacteria bacterium]
MKLCIPTSDDLGLKSAISGHFGGAPFFLIVDTETGSLQSVKNQNEHHSHGMCQPLKSLAGHEIDAVVCAGIGAGALNKLNASGIKILKATGKTVEQLVAAFKNNSLPEFSAITVCTTHDCH